MHAIDLRSGGIAGHAHADAPAPKRRVHAAVPQRTRPGTAAGLGARLRRRCFPSLPGALMTLALLALAVLALRQAWHWGVANAVFSASAEACQAARGHGACWGVVAEKHRLILFGRYPFDQHWRPLLATTALVALLLASCMPRCWRWPLLPAWGLTLAGGFALLRGGFGGLAVVGTDQWGGLPLTLLLATCGIALAYPLAIVVALGRRSGLPAVRAVCVTYVELIRGVPLISVLFMASFMFPLFLPAGFSPDVLLRVLAGIALFSAAYLAEVIRGGLQAVPRGQVEAAQALGLSYWQLQRRVVLPQALATVVPGIMNSFISVFKDTSLVTIVSLYELTGALGLALNSDAHWRPFKIEAYCFIAAVYFAACFSMSRYSLWVERQLARSRRR